MGKEKQSKDSYDFLVRLKELRKIRKLKQGKKSTLYGFGLFGLVGWSVVIPTLAGLALGIWIDKHYPSKYSWTLMLLVMGISAGCLQAWYWVQKERKRIEKEREDKKNGN